MFGIGKKKTVAGDAPADKPAKKSGNKPSSGSPGIKTWIVNHGEKVAVGLFSLFAAYLIYDGITQTPYDTTKTPDSLSQMASRVRQEIETGNHWPQLENERVVSQDFSKIVADARSETSTDPYLVNHLVQRGQKPTGQRRGDPTLLPPMDLRVHSFVGAIGIYGDTPSPVDTLFNAPPPLDPEKRKRDVPTSTTPPRYLNEQYDRGFRYSPGTPPPVPLPAPPVIPGRIARPKEYRVKGKLTLFNVVTAIVPHGEMLENYKKQFASAPMSYRQDRDSPNYLAYEVQRADVTADPNKPVEETDWKPAPDCMLERHLKERATWIGYCKDTIQDSFAVKERLTMPIPPILLDDYTGFVSHPKIPATWQAVSSDDGEMSSEEESGGEEMATDEEGNVIVQADILSVMVPPATAPTTTYTQSPTEPIPVALEPTPVKLIRFFDFGVEGFGRAYRYRVRLVLEDPNYPRAASYALKPDDLMPDVFTRIQAIEAADLEANKNLAPGQFMVRNSKLYTPWSEPSEAIIARQPSELYTTQVSVVVSSAKTSNQKEAIVETIPPKTSVAYGEWRRDEAIVVPRRFDVVRGTVLAGAVPEPGLDVIHPITKALKWFTGHKFTNAVTIADIRGGLPLATEKSDATRARDRDSLPSQGEVIAFDPRTGELVISREFDAVNGYEMYTFQGP